MVRTNLFFLFFSLSTFLFGQEKVIPITASLYNESTAIPFTRFFTTPIHPGLQLGTEINYSTNEHSRTFQTVNISYFFHNHLAQGIGAYSEFGYEYRSELGVACSGLLGVGYMHTITTAEEFSFVNGKYEKKADHGNARLFPSLSLELGYYLKRNELNSTKIFIKYQSWLEYPYSPDFIPLMTHINLHCGAKFFIGISDD